MSRTLKKALHVAEKPSAAKSISNLLSRNIRFKRGKSKYNPIYEFQGRIRNEEFNHIFTSVTGHLQNYDFFEQQYKSWHICNPKELMEPTARVKKKIPNDKKKLEESLKTLAKGVDLLVLWLDCDLEGENICYEVIDVCKQGNSNLSVEGNTIKRAKFSEITYPAIRRAMDNLVRPNKQQSDGVDARQEIDLRIGASFTRFQTLQLRDKYELNLPQKMPLSFGTCQFPTLGFVVERQQKINEFRPEQFWYIDFRYKPPSNPSEGKVTFKPVQFTWERRRLFNRLPVLTIFYNCFLKPSRVSPMGEPREAIISNVTVRPARRYKPYPLHTIDMQKRATRILRTSGKMIMDAAEKLYNLGYISYPRTETSRYSNQFINSKIQPLIAEQTKMNSAWSDYARALGDPTQQKYGRPKTGRGDDKAHPPIHPVKALPANEGKVSGMGRRLYEFIVRHFLATCSKDAIGEQTKITATIGDGFFEEKFHANGLRISQRNWLEVYPYERWSAKEIPQFRKGMTFLPEAEIKDGTTTSPPALNERDLISLMEQNGIGTDATIAQHIQTILDRKYAIKNQQARFHPTKLGMALVQGYNGIGLGLARPDLRKLMESKLKEVIRGSISRDKMVNDICGFYHRAFVELEKNLDKMNQEFERHFNPKRPGSNNNNNNFGPPRPPPSSGRGRPPRPPPPSSSSSSSGRRRGSNNSNNNSNRRFGGNVGSPNSRARPQRNGHGSFRGNSNNMNVAAPPHPLPFQQQRNNNNNNNNFVISKCYACKKGELSIRKRKSGEFFMGCSEFGSSKCQGSIWFKASVHSVTRGRTKCSSHLQEGRTVWKIRINNGSEICPVCDKIPDDQATMKLDGKQFGSSSSSSSSSSSHYGNKKRGKSKKRGRNNNGKDITFPNPYERGRKRRKK